MQDKKSYYAIIPSNVRYDTRLCANAKLLYGEISALCNERGYCWASNEYFAELYSVSRTSISKWISALKECGYINVIMQYENNKVETRRIVLSSASTELDVDTNNNNIFLDINKREAFASLFTCDLLLVRRVGGLTIRNVLNGDVSLVTST